MSFALKFDGSSCVNGYAQKNFGVAYTDIYLQCVLVLPPLFFSTSAFTGYLVSLITVSNGLVTEAIRATGSPIPSNSYISTISINNVSPAIYPDTPYCVQLHVITPNATKFEELFVNRTEIGTTNSFPTGSPVVNGIRVGDFFPACDAQEIGYIYDVKVGTTGFGSSNVFADDFSSGNFAAWTSNTGPVSIVPSPYGAITCADATPFPVMTFDGGPIFKKE